MTKLVWDTAGKKRYEYGVDRGVFYTFVTHDTFDYGVVWNGLVNVEEGSVGGEISDYHFDGVKYLDQIEPGNYQATIEAYGTPQKFKEAIGEKTVLPGLILTRQSRSLFGLSYRTFKGHDLDQDSGYKIHLVYNATAIQQGRAYPTMTESPSADTLSWRIEAFPTGMSRRRPTAHFIIDSDLTPKGALGTLESIIYGTNLDEPRLPSLIELIDILRNWTPLDIVPDTIGGLATLVSGPNDLYRTQQEAFCRALPNTRLYPSPVPGIYRLE